MAGPDDWTYTPGSTKLKDQIRLLIGDTNEARRLILDGDIATATTLGGGTLLRSAAYACDAIAAKYARDAQHSVQGVSVTQETAYAHYKKLAAEYRSRAASTGSIYAVKDFDQKTTFQDNTDLIPPYISKGMHDFQRSIRNQFISGSC